MGPDSGVMRRAGMPGPMPSEGKQRLGTASSLRPTSQDNQTRITQRVRKGPVKFPKPLPHATTPAHNTTP